MIGKIDVFMLLIMSFMITVVLALVVFLATLIAGWYHYEYRCTDNIAEKHLYIWGDIPIAEWNPIDGDPVGACNEVN